MGEFEYNGVMDDIRELHYTRDGGEFNRLIGKKLRKWERKGLKEFKDYFEKQWVDSVFNNWAIFLTHPWFFFDK